MSKRPIVTLSDLIEYTDNQNEDFLSLPLFHTTDLNSVRKMLRSGCMKAFKGDPKFNNEFLLFFFYGRAQYIDEEKLKAVYNRANPPIVFIYDLNDIPNPHRMLPFDSGGYELYEIKLEMDEFVIFFGIDSHEIGKLIGKVYSKNENYLEKIITIDHKKYPWCSPLVELVELYNKVRNPRGSTTFGDQACTVEIQYKVDIPLKPIAVFLPAYLLSDEDGTNSVIQDLNFDKNDTTERLFTYNTDEEAFHIYSHIVKEIKKKVQTNSFKCR